MNGMSEANPEHYSHIMLEGLEGPLKISNLFPFTDEEI